MPDNVAYQHAAYIAAFVIYTGYALSLWGRRRRLARLAREAGTAAAEREGR